jgi:hypothetical protein
MDTEPDILAILMAFLFDSAGTALYNEGLCAACLSGQNRKICSALNILALRCEGVC